jgi:hypothetical protein
MSHFVAKSITLKPNGDIFCVGDDNNVFPKRNQKNRFSGNLRNLFDEILNGNVRILDSANNYKWAYAFSVSKNGTDDERFEAFKNALNIKNTGKYRLASNSYVGGYVEQRGATYFRTAYKEHATCFSFFKAKFLEQRYANTHYKFVVDLVEIK